MKIFTLSVAAVAALTTLSFAGGYIEPVMEPVVETPVVVEAPAVFEGGLYIGGGISFLGLEYKIDSAVMDAGSAMPPIYDSEATWTGGTILAGYKFNPYVAVEGRYTMSLTDASWERDGNDMGDDDSELSNIAIYLKPMLPLGDLALYGLLGYGQTTIDFDDLRGEVDDSGFQWGIGAAYNVSDRLTVFTDYTVLFDDDEFDNSPASVSDFKADVITVGMTYKF